MTEDNDRDALWDIIEPFIETSLFRDLNIPKVYVLMREFEEKILERFSAKRRFGEPEWRPDRETLVWLSEKYQEFARVEEDRTTAIAFRQIAAVARAEALSTLEGDM